VKLFSSGSEADPGEQPAVLCNLSVAEQMLIAPIISMTLVFRLFPQGQLASKGHSIMFPQETTQVLTELPRRSLPIVLLKSPGCQVGASAAQMLRVRRVKNALEYLIAHNRHFQQLGIGINRASVDSLPEEGTFQVTEMDESELTATQQQQQQQTKPDQNPNDQTAQAAAEMSASAMLEVPIREFQEEFRERLLKEQLKWPTIGEQPCNEFYSTGHLQFVISSPFSHRCSRLSQCAYQKA
jgi:hypothetical protein